MNLLVILSALLLGPSTLAAPCVSIQDGVAEIMADHSDKVTKAEVGKLLIRANAQYIKLATGYQGAQPHGFYFVAFTSPSNVLMFGAFPVNGKGCLLNEMGDPSETFVWAVMDIMKARQILSKVPNQDI